MRTSKVDVTPIAERFQRSQFWRNGMAFKAADIASFCQCTKYEASLVLKVLPVHSLGNHIYTARRVHPLANAPWRKPLEWDGNHTPKYC